MRRTFAIAVALAAGCATLDHTPVDGWPELEIVEHRVPHAEMRERCSRYVGFGMSPEACAEFDFVERKCHVWLSADFPPQRFIVAHERQHCAGYDHAGSSAMARLLRQHGAAAGASR
jgi:hypothetical protein